MLRMNSKLSSEQRLRVDRRLAEELVVPVEAGEDGARDLLREAGAPLVDLDDLGDRAHTLGR